MSTTDDPRTDDELRAAIRDGERASAALGARMRAGIEATEERLKRVQRADPAAAFASHELTFAAFARCSCGAGFAYPKTTGTKGSWECAAILQGKAPVGSTHSGALPFMFYEIKSENQPSAGGATTRAADEPAAG